jgi:hypothetical protein
MSHDEKACVNCGEDRSGDDRDLCGECSTMGAGDFCPVHGPWKRSETDQAEPPKRWLTPVGVDCKVHHTFPEPDEPCWGCEHAAERLAVEPDGWERGQTATVEGKVCDVSETMVALIVGGVRFWVDKRHAQRRPTATHTTPEQCPECEGTGTIEACDPYPAMRCHVCEPPSEDVLRIVHAFDDQERKDLVRELAARVKATETALATLRQGRERAIPCSTCDGSGASKGGGMKCPDCRGSGAGTAEEWRERALEAEALVRVQTPIVDAARELLQADVLGPYAKEARPLEIAVARMGGTCCEAQRLAGEHWHDENCAARERG